MSIDTIAVLGTGNMGHAVGRALRHRGPRVITALDGRSDRSRELAELAGIEDRGDVTTLIREADIVLSILPPRAAAEFAGEAASAMASSRNRANVCRLQRCVPRVGSGDRSIIS